MAIARKIYPNVSCHIFVSGPIWQKVILTRSLTSQLSNALKFGKKYTLLSENIAPQKYPGILYKIPGYPKMAIARKISPQALGVKNPDLSNHNSQDFDFGVTT